MVFGNICIKYSIHQLILVHKYRSLKAEQKIVCGLILRVQLSAAKTELQCPLETVQSQLALEKLDSNIQFLGESYQ